MQTNCQRDWFNFDIWVVMIQFMYMTAKNRSKKNIPKFRRGHSAFLRSLTGLFFAKIAWDFYWFFKKKGKHGG